MTKFLVVAAMTVVGFSLATNEVQAARRCCRCAQRTCCAPAPSCCSAAPSCCPASAPATAPLPPQEAAPAPATAQVNGNGYQSFSYEPSAVPVAVQSTNQGYVGANLYSNQNSNYEVIRGDKKVRASYR